MSLIKKHRKETIAYLVRNIELILTLKTFMKFGNKMLKSVICKYTANTKENIS